VTLVIQRGNRTSQTEISATKVTRHPAEPSSAKFSPRNYRCLGSSLSVYFKTKITATYRDGGRDVKLSNYVIARCT
jgi:hypothetical protein